MSGIVSWVTGLLKIKGDSDGTKIGNVSDALKVDISSMGGTSGGTPGDTRLNISKQLIAKHTEDHKYGRLASVGNGQTKDINNFGDIYSKQTASTITLVSDDANDTAGGTGANYIIIYGLDTNFDVLEEVIALNGITAVTTVGSFLRVNRIRIAVQGTGDSNAGTILVKDGANILAQMDPGKGSSEQTYFTVPADTSYYVTQIRATMTPSSGNGAKQGLFEIFARVPGGAWTQFGSEGVSSDGGSTVYEANPPLKLSEKFEFVLKVTSYQNSTQATGLIQYIIVED